MNKSDLKAGCDQPRLLANAAVLAHSMYCCNNAHDDSLRRTVTLDPSYLLVQGRCLRTLFRRKLNSQLSLSRAVAILIL